MTTVSQTVPDRQLACTACPTQLSSRDDRLEAYPTYDSPYNTPGK